MSFFRESAIPPDVRELMRACPIVHRAMCFYLKGGTTYSEALEKIVIAQAESLDALKKDAIARPNVSPIFIPCGEKEDELT